MPINQFMGQAVQDVVDNGITCSQIQDKQYIQERELLESAMLAEQAWSIGMKCSWSGCTSRAVFKTRVSFNKHVRNVHTDPLLCFVANCPQKTPFGRLSDLRRHQQSAHSAERKFVCGVSSCDARIKEFARKDHLTKHMRERHDNYFCPIFHCPRSTKCSFDKPERLAEHIETDHGPYECSLGACAQAPLSKFSSRSLSSHLRNHHGTVELGSHWVEYLLEERASLTLTDLNFSKVSYSYSECKICDKQQHVAKE
jgi:hypothetical protein